MTSAAPRAPAANPTPAAASPAGHPRTITRDDLLRLGRQAQPWEFLALAPAAIRQLPTDEGLRFLAAANLGKLGLRTLALEQLDYLADSSRAHPDVAALRAALSGLPDDAISFDRRLANVLRALAAIARNSPDAARAARQALPAWATRQRDHRLFLTTDGNAIRTAAESAGLPADVTRGNIRAAIESSVRKAVADAPDGMARPAVIEGVDPPWALTTWLAATPATRHGYQPRAWVVQADVLELLDGLSISDLSGSFDTERVGVIVGPDGAARLASTLRESFHTIILGPLFPIAREPCRGPSCHEALAAVQREQDDRQRALRVEVDGAYAGRSREWWLDRYRQGLANAAEPLRVLIPTCRYSTFVQHSSRDLAGAFERAGWQARVIIEPDRFSRLSGLAYLGEFSVFRPDLVVLINYPRHVLRGVMASDVPYVCWVQDSMPHLFDPAVGRAQGPLDFMIGHLGSAMFDRFGYALERSESAAIPADTRKFHDGPVDPALLARYRCDVAMLTHHSEPPDDMHARLASEVAASAPSIAARLGTLRAAVESAVAQCTGQSLEGLIADAARDFARAAGAADDPRLLHTLIRNYAVPLADRILRHQVLAWAIEIAQRRSWRLHLYGHGWKTLPHAAPFARGEVAHGDELRAAYQCAAAHLHCSGTNIVHQRVIECFLSGGVCLSRAHREAIIPAATGYQLRVIQRQPDQTEADGSRLGYTIIDHPELLALASLQARTGCGFDGPTFWTRPEKVASQRRLRHILVGDLDPTGLLGDVPEFCFTSESELEERLERAIEQPSWRQNANAAVRARIHARLTTDVIVQKMVTLVARGLAGAAT